MKKSELKKVIREIPDFPKEGILFYDITTLLKNKDAFKKAIDLMARKFKKGSIDQIVAIESRGFIFGAALAYKLGAGFVPVRKKGKLPGEVQSVSYELEYGTDTLEIHKDAISPNDKVIIVDDLLATGGTIKAVAELVKGLGAKIEDILFLVELRFLKGKNKIKDFPYQAFIKY